MAQLNTKQLTRILNQFPEKKIAVIGDFFLDQYWHIESSLSELSLETGKTAYQVTGKRLSPGAAGTVAAILRSLKVEVIPVGFCGDDSFGFDLRNQMRERGMALNFFYTFSNKMTPTYTKPMLFSAGVEEELNRFDFKNRSSLSPEQEALLISGIDQAVEYADGVIIMDQVLEKNCGVVTDAVRKHLAKLSTRYPDLWILADSRGHITDFQNVGIKINHHEARRALPHDADLILPQQAQKLFEDQTNQHPVIITRGSKGILVYDQQGFFEVPAIQIDGEIDIVGAGDSVTASMMASLCSGASLQEAAVIGNITASLIVQQIGTTGTATREQIFDRYIQKFL